MKINHTKPSALGYLVLPFRDVYYHIALAAGMNTYAESTERIKHVALAILKLIPVIGHVASIVHLSVYQNEVKSYTIDETDPFKKGEQHGTRFQTEIRELYSLILSKHDSLEMRDKVREFEKNIPDDLKREMQGLAKGAGVSYDDVLFVHCFLDAEPNPSNYGCTAMAHMTLEGDAKEQRIVAANHAVPPLGPAADAESAGRAMRLQKAVVDPASPEKALKAVNVENTIHSIVFDCTSKQIRVAASGNKAADAPFSTFSLAPASAVAIGPRPSAMKILRNLDWPWYFLGQNTVVLTRKTSSEKTYSSVTFPGYLGTLSGMNESGLALAVCSRDSVSNPKGVPNPLLFTHLLMTCDSVKEAVDILKKTDHGSSMNVILADSQEATSLELQGKGPLNEFDRVKSISAGMQKTSDTTNAIKRLINGLIKHK